MDTILNNLHAPSCHLGNSVNVSVLHDELLNIVGQKVQPTGLIP